MVVKFQHSTSLRRWQLNVIGEILYFSQMNMHAVRFILCEYTFAIRVSNLRIGLSIILFMYTWKLTSGTQNK